MAYIEAARPFQRYHEPFMGGGAVFFELARVKGLGRSKSYLSDRNANLIDAYRGLREDVDSVIGLLLEHKARHSTEHYYEVRASVPATLLERAARIVYLNKTCYNGLFRENGKGQFNVPVGRYVNPQICDEANLRACAKVLKHAQVDTRGFETVLEHAKPNDFVYFDPPYHPLSKTAKFTGYDKGGFGEDSQRRLAEVFAELNVRGVKVLLSNSMTDFVRELYGNMPGVKIEEVLATRCVNSRADRRGKISEALVRNF